MLSIMLGGKARRAARRCQCEYGDFPFTLTTLAPPCPEEILRDFIYNRFATAYPCLYKYCAP
jgi:hypothetical protein